MDSILDQFCEQIKYTARCVYENNSTAKRVVMNTYAHNAFKADFPLVWSRLLQDKELTQG
jgi:hypothetical protein